MSDFCEFIRPIMTGFMAASVFAWLYWRKINERFNRIEGKISAVFAELDRKKYESVFADVESGHDTLKFIYKDKSQGKWIHYKFSPCCNCGKLRSRETFKN